MAKLPDTPQPIATFDLEPAPNCPQCANKIMQVRIDGAIAIGALTHHDDQLLADVSLRGQTLTALPCGCQLDGPEGGD